ncbi:MAG: hypothetical protein H0W64_08370 [Gammaproteobacteria bacterium]|nr:hypothetical protein [Gammaproteobacteria bacterium]
MQIKEWLRKTGEWGKHFLDRKEEIFDPSYQLSIFLSSQTVSLVLIKQDGFNATLIQTEYHAINDTNQAVKIIQDFTIKNQVVGVTTTWLLGFEDYQLFLIESLPVPKDEFQEALQWRIRSLITFPLEEATLDYFTLPSKKNAPENPMIAAIISKSSQLLKGIELIKKSNIRLDKIDIPELAMRNLTAFFENDEKSSAFIYFSDGTLILNITRQKTLYFTRRITWSNPDTPTVQDYEQIGLDILRYFDYFQSQWRFPSPNRVFLASSKIIAADAARTLSEYLALSVELFPFEKLGLGKKENEIEMSVLLNIGCLLKEKDNVTAGS